MILSAKKEPKFEWSTNIAPGDFYGIKPKDGAFSEGFFCGVIGHHLLPYIKAHMRFNRIRSEIKTSE